MASPDRISAHGMARGRSIVILVFHRVLRDPDPMFPEAIDADRFERYMSILARRFNVLRLDEAVRRLATGNIPPRSVCISFDDGYADNFEIALPILNRVGLCASFFITTAFLDGGMMWNDMVAEALKLQRLDTLDLRDIGLGQHPVASLSDRRAAYFRLVRKIKYESAQLRTTLAIEVARHAEVECPDKLMMNREQVRALADAGMEIGAHTVTHPILARLSREQAEREVRNSRTALESIVDGEVCGFAYPNGKPGLDYTLHDVELVRNTGFAYAVSTQPGRASQNSDNWQLPRYGVWDRDGFRFGIRMLARCWGGLLG